MIGTHSAAAPQTVLGQSQPLFRSPISDLLDPEDFEPPAWYRLPKSTLTLLRDGNRPGKLALWQARRAIAAQSIRSQLNFAEYVEAMTHSSHRAGVPQTDEGFTLLATLWNGAREFVAENAADGITCPEDVPPILNRLRLAIYAYQGWNPKYRARNRAVANVILDVAERWNTIKPGVSYAQVEDGCRIDWPAVAAGLDDLLECRFLAAVKKPAKHATGEAQVLHLNIAFGADPDAPEDPGAQLQVSSATPPNKQPSAVESVAFGGRAHRVSEPSERGSDTYGQTNDETRFSTLNTPYGVKSDSPSFTVEMSESLLPWAPKVRDVFIAAGHSLAEVHRALTAAGPVGLSPAQVAAAVGCSERTARRLLKELDHMGLAADRQAPKEVTNGRPSARWTALPVLPDLADRLYDELGIEQWKADRAARRQKERDHCAEALANVRAKAERERVPEPQSA